MWRRKGGERFPACMENSPQARVIGSCLHKNTEDAYIYPEAAPQHCPFSPW